MMSLKEKAKEKAKKFFNYSDDKASKFLGDQSFEENFGKIINGVFRNLGHMNASPEDNFTGHTFLSWLNRINIPKRILNSRPIENAGRKFLLSSRRFYIGYAKKNRNSNIKTKKAIAKLALSLNRAQKNTNKELLG